MASFDEISDVEDAIESTSSSSSDDDDDECLQGTTVSGVKQLETIYTCISCNRNVHPTNAHVGICDSCNTTQKLSSSKQSAKLLLQSGTRKVNLRVYDEALKAIANSETDITAQALLFAPEFECVYNKLV